MAEFLEAAAPIGRGFNLKVCKACSRLDGDGKAVLGVGLAGRKPPRRLLFVRAKVGARAVSVRLSGAAGCNQGNIRLSEQVFYLAVSQRTKIKAYFRHLKIGQYFEYFVVRFVLQACADHSN